MTNLFADRYDIQRELGHGAFGMVYLAHDLRLRGRPVALKVLHPALTTDPGVVRLFDNEAGVLATLQHDHIVTVYDAGLWEHRRFIVMAFIDGPSLAQVVREQGAQPPEQVAEWLAQIAAAMTYAHQRQVLHRDIKSANLLFDTNRNRVVITDFGLARAVEMSGGSSLYSNTSALTGTAAYRAPEVARQGHSVASDLYSVGVVAYELLAGRLPFESNDPLSLLLFHATEPPPPLPESTPDYLAQLVASMLGKRVEDRPNSAEIVWEQLQAPKRAEQARLLQAEVERLTELQRQAEQEAQQQTKIEADRCYEQGKEHLRQRSFEQAIAFLSKAIELDPRRADFYWDRGKSYTWLKNYEQAIADHTKAIELDPQRADFYWNRGKSYTWLKNYEQAIADYTKAIELDPRRADYYYSRSLSYRAAGQGAQADADLARARELGYRE
jgi:serine/threonine-protein kinase